MLIKRIGFSMIVLSIMLTAGCGLRLQGSYLIPSKLQTMALTSQDKYSKLTRLVNERMRLNNIKIVELDKSTPRLNLISDSLERSTLSFYPTGNVAEYELMYHVNFTIQMPNEEAKPFQVEIRRDYLDDPRTALAKSREMNLLVNEMRIQAADKIVQAIAAFKQ
ncbi:LPS assembly lipoprotein LptE [Parashewanella tropica]|uniref:LPS-assembly lipoprotein LptE n=1 Tax=Parashewanella tropica TaxID=2547970 RepID=UPI00105A84B4|nr:LPS assembly lipoprotein LptE [Parashewanella tropica]